MTELELRSTLRLVVYVVGFTDVTQGLGYLLGAPASAPSLQLMAQIAPMGWWGAALAAAGLLLIFRRTARVGLVLGGLVTLLWAGFAAAVLFTSSATGWGWVWPMGFAVLHISGVWIASRLKHRRQ